MPFEEIKKFLLCMGVHPQRYKEKWQSNLRIGILIAIFYNQLPLIHNLVYQFNCANGFMDYAQTWMFLSYVFMSGFVFMFLVYNIEKVAGVTKFIEENLENSEKSDKAEIRVMRMHKAALTQLICQHILCEFMKVLDSRDGHFLREYRFPESFPWVLVIALKSYSLVLNLTAIFCQVAVVFLFFNISIHFETIYKSLSTQIRKLDEAQTLKDQSVIIKDFVESHVIIMDQIKTFTDCFKRGWTTYLTHLVFCNSLIMFTVTDQTAEDRFKMFIYFLAVPFATMVFCKPSEILWIQVR